jgi:hypothetical protein
VIGFQSEVPPGIDATLDLQVKITNDICEPFSGDLVFEFYRGKGCQGSPLKVLTASNITASCGDNCYIFAWGPVPNLGIGDWYSVKLDFEDLCEDCYDFHIGDPIPIISEEINF